MNLLLHEHSSKLLAPLLPQISSEHDQSPPPAVYRFRPSQYKAPLLMRLVPRQYGFVNDLQLSTGDSPQVTSHVNQSIEGVWGDEPDLLDKLDSYLSMRDAYSDPRYRRQQRVAQSLMSVRVDSRGDPLSRALLGNMSLYKSVIAKSRTNRRYESGQESLRKESKPDSRFERLQQEPSKVTIIGSLNLQDKSRQEKATLRQSQYQQDWDKLMLTAKESRKNFAVKNTENGVLRKSQFRLGDAVTLLERSNEFGYDSYGSKMLPNKAHLCANYSRKRMPADFVQRRDAWYQSCHGAGVKYNPTSPKNLTSIFSTLPVARAHQRSRKSPKVGNYGQVDMVGDSIFGSLESARTLDMIKQYSSKRVQEKRIMGSNAIKIGESPSQFLPALQKRMEKVSPRISPDHSLEM